MDNPYFRPNSDVQVRMNKHDQQAGQQQAEMDVAAMEATKQMEEMAMLDQMAQQQGLGGQLPVQQNPQGLGAV